MVLQIKVLPYQGFTTKCFGQRRTHVPFAVYTRYRNLLEAVVVYPVLASITVHVYSLLILVFLK